MSMNFDRQSLLAELAASIRLREGANGISKALWHLYRGKAHSIHDWSKAVQLPVPVLAALRRELEKRAILKPQTRIVISENGKEVLRLLFHSAATPQSVCEACNGLGYILPMEAMGLVDEMRAIGANRPAVDVRLDQSHATAETAVRKALLLLEHGLLQDSIVFMGDDDLISLACRLVRKHSMPHHSGLGELCVLDVDARYLQYIQDCANGEILTGQYDVRDDLPQTYRGKFRVALTDPAYTVNGVTVFAARCHQATTDEGSLYLSMPKMDPQMAGQIQLNLLQLGYSLQEQWNQLNEYTGASIHAHVSMLTLWQKWNPTSPQGKKPDLQFQEFYTAERRRKGKDMR